MTSAPISAEEQRALDAVRAKLEATYPDVETNTVRVAVEDAHRRFDGGRIRDFVPLFVERAVSKQFAEVSA